MYFPVILLPMEKNTHKTPIDIFDCLSSHHQRTFSYCFQSFLMYFWIVNVNSSVWSFAHQIVPTDSRLQSFPPTPAVLWADLKRLGECGYQFYYYYYYKFENISKWTVTQEMEEQSEYSEKALYFIFMHACMTAVYSYSQHTKHTHKITFLQTRDADNQHQDW